MNLSFGNLNTIEKIRGHWKLMKELWRAIAQIAAHRPTRWHAVWVPNPTDEGPAATQLAAQRAARTAARKRVAKQTPFNGMLEWVRANVGDSAATMIEQARGDTTDGLRAQLALKDKALTDTGKAMAKLRASLQAAQARKGSSGEA